MLCDLSLQALVPRVHVSAAGSFWSRSLCLSPYAGVEHGYEQDSRRAPLVGGTLKPDFKGQVGRAPKRKEKESKLLCDVT